MKISPINLLRFLFNSSFRTNFIAGEGYIQFIGSLIYEKGEECLISLNTSKNNGVVYFAKGMAIKTLL
jgi:hypothetical protein